MSYIDKITDKDSGESRIISPAADAVRVDNENYEGSDLDDVLDEIAEAIDDAGSGGYAPPPGGIPATDLAPAVRTSLGKADSAYQKPASGIPKTDLEQSVQDTLDDVADKVDKVTGKGLSTNDYTTEDKNKLANLPTNPVQSVTINGTTHTPTNGIVDLGNVQGQKGDKGDTGNVEFEDLDDLVALLVNDLTTGGAGNFLSAEMGKRLKAKIEEVNANILRLYNNLGNIAFWDAASKANAAPSELDWGNPKHNVTLSLTLANAVVTHNGTEKSSGSVIQVEEGAKLTLIVAPAPNYALSGAPTASVGGSAITPTDNGNGTYTIELTMAQSDVTLAISATGAATYSIGYTLTNCTATTRPTSVGAGGSATIVLEADSGYTLPSSLPSGAVTGASVTSWSAATGTLVIGNVTGNVAISVAAIVDYIQDGLAFHLDGTDRGGQTGHWIDKVGLKDFVLTDCTENADNVQFNGTSSKGVLASGDLSAFMSRACTIECVMETADLTNVAPIILNPVEEGILMLMYLRTGSGFVTGAYGSFKSSAPDIINQIVLTDLKNSVSASAARTAKNGVVTETHGGGYAFAYLDTYTTECTIGYRHNGSGDRKLTGKIYDIRIYNRQLTAAEIQHNYAVDVAKYNL